MKTIISRQNPEVISVAALDNAKERAKQGKFVAEGLRTCLTLIKSPIRLAQLYVTEHMLPAVEKKIKANLITVVPQPVIEKMSNTTTASGIVGVFHLPPALDPQQMEPGLVLDTISDPGNMGALLRSAVAFGVKSVVIIGGTDVWSPKVVQASAGMLGNVSIYTVSAQAFIKYSKGKKVCGLVVSGGKQLTAEYKDAFLIVGNEAHGISKELFAHCTDLLTITMQKEAESLNAAIAGSLALYLTRAP